MKKMKTCSEDNMFQGPKRGDVKIRENTVFLNIEIYMFKYLPQVTY